MTAQSQSSRPIPAGLGFLRAALISPELRVADVDFNASEIENGWRQAAASGARLVVFPELCLTAYTCADLFYDARLRSAALGALRTLREASAAIDASAIIGLPLEAHSRIFNVAAVLANGRIWGFVPKTHLPTYREFYEQRWFSSARELMAERVEIDGEPVPIGTDLLFAFQGDTQFMLGIEICEDLWAVEPPSGKLALAGATVIANPSASPEILGKAGYRRALVQQQSARTFTSYLYAAAGPGESSTDLVYSGHCLAAENGRVIGEGERFNFESQIVVVDLDLEQATQDRLRNSSFAEAGRHQDFRTITVGIPDTAPPPNLPLRRPLEAHPFVPGVAAQRAERCREIFAIQATGLAKRLRHTGLKRIVVGISGGLDSTLALLVGVRAFDQLKLPREGILGVTMPGFGTTQRTQSNAVQLMKLLGIDQRTISIDAACRQHFADLGHDESVHDVVYENTQARERTQILMDLANQVGGFVLGTGDLSETALGWCTYAGDHISMYHVNVGVPKTLVRTLVDWCADEVFGDEARALLHNIADTPITPELLPLSEQGQLEQKTEESIGPYELHDFFLFQVVRYGYAPEKVLFLAQQAFARKYPDHILKRYLGVFYRRFFSQQFKRSCFTDGPKVGTVALSPRGDWRMPSDAVAKLWLDEVERWEG